MKTRLRMAWALLRGRSVCYRMDVSPDGLKPTTVGGLIVENRIHDMRTGIYID